MKQQKQFHSHYQKKYLGINLTTRREVLYNGHLQNIAERKYQDPNKWKAVCSWIGWLNVVKMPILPILIYRFNVLPNQYLSRLFLFSIIDMKITKFMWKFRGHRLAKIILKRKNKLKWFYFKTLKIWQSRLKQHWLQDRHINGAELRRLPDI